MNSHFLTTDTSRLQQTTGYWSHEKILCNTTDQVVLLYQPDSDQLRNEAITLQDFVRNSKSFKATTVRLNFIKDSSSSCIY